MSHPVYLAAEALLAAAHEFWQAKQDAGQGAAVVWVTDTDGRTLIFTRGEYREQLMSVVDGLNVSRQTWSESGASASVALDLLDQLAEDTPCRLDHTNYCQEHGNFGGGCAHAEAHKLLVDLGVRDA